MKMHNLRFSLICIIATVLCTSCSLSYQTITIEELQPSETAIPEHLKKIGFLNQITPVKSLDFENRKSIKSYLSQDIQIAVQNAFIETPKYDSVKLIKSSSNFFADKIDWPTVEKICLLDTLDAIIVLNYVDYEIEESTAEITEKWLKENFRTLHAYDYITFFKTSVYGNFMLIDPYKRTYWEKIFVQDKNWTGLGYSITQSKEELPDTLTALGITATLLGNKYAKYIAPYWLQGSRKFYTANNDQLRLAKQLADSNQWQKSIEVLKPITNYPSIKIAKAARMNLALAYEITGDLKKAKYWAQNVYDNFKLKDALEYSTLLEKKIQIEAKLDEQF